MNNFSIRQFKATDWNTYRDMRLAALLEHPDYFDPTSDETQFTDQDWKDRLTSASSATFGLYNNENLIGITTIFRKENTGHFVASYIQKAYRGKGLSKLLYEARIDWAKKQNGIKTIVLEHHEDNVSSQKAHEKFGFKLTGSYMYRWPDGQDKLCKVYELEL